MFKNAFIVIIIASFACFLYGIRNLFLEVEKNECRMTYMFGVPQFSKLDFHENSLYPHYELYYYYEGRIYKDVNTIKLRGAPVLFIPGNGGSYKQARSLASVALRKGMDNDRGIHLDYFTINFEEQLSALYGGYLENQKHFVRLAILAIRRLYKNTSNVEKQVILVGHSMGGKVAQAVLQEPGMAAYINSIIFISSPLDEPVINFDSKLSQFYATSNEYLSTKRISHLPNRQTNVCTKYLDKIPQQMNESMILDNILMISMGGGNRDLLVRDSLTTSQYSDIHAMTSSIPGVWLSCDHLSAVWCLQLIKVITRFLFAITVTDERKNVFFLNEKTQRTQTAINYFVKPLKKHKSNVITFPKTFDDSIWQEDVKIAFKKSFKNGLRVEYNHLMPIAKYREFKKVFIEIDSFEDFENDWIFACSANEVGEEKRRCEKGISLAHYVQSIPSQEEYRYMALLDFQHINKYFPNWTHLFISIKPTNKPVTLKIDAYKKDERKLNVKAPRWFSFKPKFLINETIPGSVHYDILIEDLDEPFPTLQFKFEPIACAENDFEIKAKICVPWARGFDRYVNLAHDSKDNLLYVNVPFATPNGYNTTENPVSLELFLNPACRYKISYQFSIAGTASKIVQEFVHWLPAHLTAVLFLVLRNQVVKFQSVEKSLFVKPYAGFFQSKSLYIVTACRLLKKLLLPYKSLPLSLDPSNYSFYVSIIIHGTAIILSIIAVFVIWTILTFHGNVLHKIALKMTRISTASSDVLMKIITTLPLTFGVLFVSISLASCSGIGLTLATVFYFLMISNAYKDYIENWAWDKAKGLFRKIRQKFDENKTRKQMAAMEANGVEPMLSGENSALVASSQVEDNDEPNQLLAANETIETTEEEEVETCEYFEGLENFAFHITMLLLLGIMSALNFGLSIAWIKSKYHGHITEHLPDPFILPTIVVLSCLSLLLQLEAPRKSSGYHLVSIVLYSCVCACVLYCQEHIYRLNYLIAFVYLLVALQEVIHRLRRFF